MYNCSSENIEALKIEIGCGKNPLKGFLTCDIRDLPNVDYVCKADKLPFNNGTIAELYSRHVIEHFTLKEFLKVLFEWNRVLKNNGVLYIICPNLLWHLRQILDSDHKSFYIKESGINHRYWGYGSLFGWQQDEFDLHKFGYYPELLIDILFHSGFGEFENLTNSGRGIENKPWHLELKAKRKFDAPNYLKNKFYSHFDVKH